MSEAQHDRIVELEDALAKANRINADLLAACRALVRNNDGPGEFGEALTLAQAAIAKATGAA